MSGTYDLGPFVLDAGAGVLLHDGQPTGLGGRAVAVLHALVARAEQFVTKDEILQAAWPGLVVEESNLSVQISAIRRVIAHAPGGERWLETLARRGYRFVGPVVPRGTPSAAQPVGEAVSAAPPRSNLPHALSSFVGRAAELAEIARLLAHTRLLSLVGSGGVGKTRLALKLAGAQLAGFADGVAWVELAPLFDPRLVPQAVARALGLAESAGRTIEQVLLDHLRERHVLLVLDNAEHLLEACARLVGELLQACPQLRLLVTSRERLGVTGEQVYRVPSLAMPGAAEADDPAALAVCESVQLFVERARELQPQFQLGADNAAALAQLCRRLDGIPMALELAAARIRSMTPAEALQRLDQRFMLLNGGSRQAPRRQQTLRALIDWSYALLRPAEQALLQRLSVFAGGCTLLAAEAVCAGDSIETWEMLDLLTALVDKSLLTVAERAGQTRYGMLESVRQYARERLDEAEGAQQWVDAHLAYYFKLAAQAESQVDGPRQEGWMTRLDDEIDNLRAAMEGALTAPARAADALNAASALRRYWSLRGQHAEGRRWCGRLLDAVPPRSSLARAKGLRSSGELALSQADYDAAEDVLERSLAMSRELGDERGIAAALGNLGYLRQVQGRFTDAHTLLEEALAYERTQGASPELASLLNELGGVHLNAGDGAAAARYYEKSLAVARQCSSPTDIAVATHNLGVVSLDQSLDYDRAVALLEESLAMGRQAGYTTLFTSSLGNLAFCRTELGDLDSAERHLREGLVLARALGNRRFVAIGLQGLADVAGRRNDASAAMEFARQSLQIFAELGDPSLLAWCLREFGYLARAMGLPQRAARLLGAAQGLREQTGKDLLPRSARRRDSELAALQATLGATIFEACYTEGRTMSTGQAIALAMSDAAN